MPQHVLINTLLEASALASSVIPAELPPLMPTPLLHYLRAALRLRLAVYRQLAQKRTPQELAKPETNFAVARQIYA